MRKSQVAILKTAKNPGEEEIQAKVREAVDSIGGIRRFVKRGDLVIVKPNLVIGMTAEAGVTTDVRVSKAVADLVREQGARAVIGESCGTGGDTEKVFEATGYDKLRNQGYEVIDFKKMDSVEITIPKAKIIKRVKIPVLVKEADVLISLPKIKTHDQVVMSAGLKNMKGALEDRERNRLHKDNLSQGIADINSFFRVKLVVVDGIVGMEGVSSIFGDRVEMNLLLAGDDPVAVDTVIAHIMEVDPNEVYYIRYSHEMGIGTMDMNEIEVLGNKISEVKRRFKRSDEDLKKIQIPGFKMMMHETACTGCRYTMYSVIKDMRKKGLMEHLNGLTALVGEIDELPKVDKRSLVLVGTCAGKKKEEGVRFAPGCPPRNYWVIEAITGTPQQSLSSDLRQEKGQLAGD